MDDMSDESEAVTREQASAAVREQVARLAGPPGVTVPMIVGALQVAVRHGTTLFNTGDVEGCFELYRDTADWLLQAAGRQPGQRPAMVTEVLEALRNAMERARRGSGYHDRAWTFRHTFDWLMADHYAEMRRVVGLWMMSQSVISRGDFAGAVAMLDSALRNAAAIRGGVDAEEEGAHVSWMAQLTAGHARLLNGDVDAAWELISEVLLLAPHTLAHVPNLRRAGAHWRIMQQSLARAAEQGDAAEYECFRAYLMLQARENDAAAEILLALLQRHPDHEAAQMLLALATSSFRDKVEGTPRVTILASEGSSASDEEEATGLDEADAEVDDDEDEAWPLYDDDLDENDLDAVLEEALAVLGEFDDDEDDLDSEAGFQGGDEDGDEEVREALDDEDRVLLSATEYDAAVQPGLWNLALRRPTRGTTDRN